MESKGLRLLAFGCGAALVAGAIGLGACVLLLKSAADEPAAAAAGLLGDLRAHDNVRALQRMSRSYQASHPLPVFQQNVLALAPLAVHTDASLTSHSLDPFAHSATIEGTLTTPSGRVPVRIELIEDSGFWYVDIVRVANTPLR